MAAEKLLVNRSGRVMVSGEGVGLRVRGAIVRSKISCECCKYGRIASP
jgi:hypothetical protein